MFPLICFGYWLGRRIRIALVGRFRWAFVLVVVLSPSARAQYAPLIQGQVQYVSGGSTSGDIFNAATDLAWASDFSNAAAGPTASGGTAYFQGVNLGLLGDGSTWGGSFYVGRGLSHVGTAAQTLAYVEAYSVSFVGSTCVVAGPTTQETLYAAPSGGGYAYPSGALYCSLSPTSFVRSTLFGAGGAGGPDGGIYAVVPQQDAGANGGFVVGLPSTAPVSFPATMGAPLSLFTAATTQSATAVAIGAAEAAGPWAGDFSDAVPTTAPTDLQCATSLENLDAKFEGFAGSYVGDAYGVYITSFFGHGSGSYLETFTDTIYAVHTEINFGGSGGPFGGGSLVSRFAPLFYGVRICCTAGFVWLVYAFCVNWMFWGIFGSQLGIALAVEAGSDDAGGVEDGAGDTDQD